MKLRGQVQRIYNKSGHHGMRPIAKSINTKSICRHSLKMIILRIGENQTIGLGGVQKAGF